MFVQIYMIPIDTFIKGYMLSSSGLLCYIESSVALMIMHECVIITKKLHKIPYHMVNHA